MVYKIINGAIPSGSEWMSNSVSSLKLGLRNVQRELQDRSVVFSSDGGEWAEAYSDSNGRLNSVTGAGPIFDTDKYKAVTSSTEPFVIIEATSLTESAFNINDCNAVEVSSGKWQVSCDVGNNEVKRAKIYNTLFGGGSSSLLVTSVTSVTALKTNIARDVGKRGIYSVLSSAGSPGGNYTGYWTGTFSDTSDNTDFSSWSNCDAFYNSGDVHEKNTDTTADELSNPATCQLEYHRDPSSSANYTRWETPSGTQLNIGTGGSGSGGTGYAVSVVMLCSGSISWVSSGNIYTAPSEYDSFADGSIPLFTATTEDYSNTILHTVPTGSFSSTISSCFGSALVADWESGADIQYKLTGTAGAEDTGWLTYNEISTFTPFTAEPDTCIVKLIPKTTTPTAGYPSINAFGVVE